MPKSNQAKTNEAKTTAAKCNEAKQTTGLILAQRDPRADGGLRQVRVERERVVIFRRLRGISMRIGAPVDAYRGVALAIEPAEQGGAAYRLSLAHHDPEFDVVLMETDDSRQAAADWRYWAFYLGLPRLAEENGAARPLTQAKDAGPRMRTRGAGLGKRRPRFLARRKTGDGARARMVFAGEREIVCYE